MDIAQIRQDIQLLLNFKNTITALYYSTADKKLVVEVQTKIGERVVTLKASDTSIRGVTDTLNFQNQTICGPTNTMRINQQINKI